ncbi:N-acylneuraminate cytidylyltransferase [Pseudoalteromonas sp. BSi20311]|jgi:N-acylneuraminate cytidylyltransferase|uniref:acylneuraminate cytidylyltransferase family protein n=1 Tax=Pseudoalteromonas sp. BSi20311 TaxID=383911 RepID=UPI000231AC47|nr:acylneuraminate cytidylyltransferase family protein [Pseudoalteromonas sp. BSi20311]GAA65010.1 N-acylneuraminate cytidylyltransferase [Pseudoalteromonas sp. BSi20311]
MNSKKTILAIIPARGGSKRLPGKNILPLAGKPMINWSIEAAKNIPSISRVVVSTDCEVIANIARTAGGEVPFLRPASISSDKSSSLDLVYHALEYFKGKGEYFDYVLLLQPTSPLRSSDDIEGAINLLNTKSADSVISVCECEHSPLWANTLDDSLSLKNFLPKHVQNIRSQDLPQYYRLNGAIYLAKVEQFLKEGVFMTGNSVAYKMDRHSSVDIDTKLDFIIAETILREKIYE